ncbi:conserved hypothetical protein [uncultured Mycobacterium sp.]|uniref:Uncharacterized protein n=1 Tax=uncultured Mycobacterium sp. TaxID=171292 RepID=A0A1Y5PFA3_9MYCO|nr:conserved hypothetical protein [uncultured Mycobacterium sp.]
MLRSVQDLVHLRWRTAQVLLAVVDGTTEQVRVLRQAMQIEGIETSDTRDEMALLLRQFGPRAPVWLRGEINRLSRQLRQWCGRCGRRNRYFDNRGICVDCVVEERRERCS